MLSFERLLMILKTKMSIFISIVFVSLKTSIIGTDESRSNLSYRNENGKCRTNYYPKNGYCLACPLGYFGTNCTSKCPRGSYGQLCSLTCYCNDEDCDYKTGCPTQTSIGSSRNVSTLSSVVTLRQTLQNEEIRRRSLAFDTLSIESSATKQLNVWTTQTVRLTDPSDTKEDTTFQPKNGVVLGSAGVVSLLIIILIVHIRLKMRVHRQEQEEQANLSTDDGKYDEINEVNLNNVPNEEIEIENPRRKYEFVHEYQNVNKFIYSKMENDNTKYHEIIDLIETDESMISGNRYSHDMLVNENNINVYEEPRVSASKHMYIDAIELESRNCSEDIEQALNREANISEKPHYENHFFIEDHEPSLHNTDIDSNNSTQQDISSSCPPKDGTYLDVVF